MIRRLHLPLFLLALAIAVVIKVAVHEAIELRLAAFNAQVRYVVPEDLVILEPVREVEVRLRAERDEIAVLNPWSVEVELKILPSDRGTVEITEDRLTVRAPGDFEVVSIVPNRFTLKVEQKVTRSLPVRVVLTGEPSAGALPGVPVIKPPSALAFAAAAEAEVAGPRSRVQSIAEVTAPVSLNGHAFDFEEQVTVVSPDPLVKVLKPKQVTVFVPMTIPGAEAPADESLVDPEEKENP